MVLQGVSVALHIYSALTIAGIFYPELAYLSERGFLAVSSNSGHNGTSAGAFLHQPEVFRDFTWRALYAATEIGKEVSKEIYSTPPKRSYFVGCSQGGRQGFKAAQFNPELFDGIIAGAPGLRLPGLFQHITRWVRTLGTDVNNLTISIDKWSAIQNETLRQCDHLDGIADGFIEDSRRCNPELSTLLCGNTTTPATCLSPEELAVVSQLFVPWHINNTLIYHGMAHNGGEVQHAKQLTGVDFLNFAIEWPRFVSLQDPSWTLDDWTPTDALLAINQDLFGFNTWEGDLSKFRNRGGKILHYHGVLDQAIDSTVSDAYYQHVSETLGATPAEIDEFYRYFHISGLEHCTGGPGAGSLGQISSSPPASEDEEDSVLSRIVAWVEKGEAPDTVGGAKFVNNDVAQGVEFKRKHCRYPFRNVYYGSGDGTDEEGWRCVE